MDSEYPAIALRLASESEGTGLVLNERYTFEEYIYRRGNFLGRQPEYAHLQNACFIARRHAAEVYPNDQAVLHVQDVRAREIATEQDPLLPLPTTSNTESIDGFATCLPDGLAGQTGNSQSPNLSLQPRVRGPRTRNSASRVARDRVSTTPVSIAPTTNDESAITSSLNTAAASAQATDTSFTLPSSPGSVQASSSVQHVHESQKRGEAPTEASAIELAMQAKRNEPLNPPDGATDAIEPPTGLPIPINRPQALAIADGPITTPPVKPTEATLSAIATTSRVLREPKLTAAPGVSAMAGYGMKVPVKSRGKRSHDEDEEGAESDTTLTGDDDEKDHATAEPSKKKTKTAAMAEQIPFTADAPPKGVARTVKKSATNVKANISTPRASAPPKVKATASKATTPKTSTPKAGTPANLNAVINGLALPKTREAAIAASSQRREALIRTRTSAGPTPTMSRSGRHQKPTPKNPSAINSVQANLMPEFFPPCTENGNDVHCICGVEDDDNGHMVQCEKCFVWQHSGCLLPGLTKKEVNKVDFLCQVCDPWKRRAVLQDLRKREGKVD
ncbi:hypothetical protein B0A48_04408 [Cryoendolithus antarcticus]|uniref:Zinc finger PHD-type domain-containing protein n=1 Tax=Cryoendolithus antarcticus TaxID=1507870 RepID=A0A1V8TFQ1_9PEZI|nr:hypothetical protein B0A48_04408 [Cryoendolithus antarcticus]